MKINTTLSLDLLMDLLSINTSQKDGLKIAKSILTNWARNNDLKLKIWPQNPSLLFETKPGHKKHISFVCHLDVVGDGGWQEAFNPKIIKGRVFGRGSVDDKGPLVVCLDVLRQSKDIEANISCLIVTDEETVNQDILQTIKEKGFKPQFCIVADGGQTNTIDIGQKGNLIVDLKIKTLGGHSAFENDGQSASDSLLDCIQTLKISTQKPGPSFNKTYINISSIKVFTTPFNMPTKAKVKLQICFSPPETADHWANILEKIKTDMSKKQIDLEYNISWKSEPHLLTDNNFLNLLKKSSPKIVFQTTGGNNMSKDLMHSEIPAVSHCPTDHYNAHCDNESIKIKDLKKGILFYKNIVNNFAKIESN